MKNAFKDLLNMSLNQHTTLPTRLTLYDLDANIIWEQSYVEITIQRINGIKTVWLFLA
jgi:hypothetical protein